MKQTSARASQGPWWRFSRYEIEDGYIRPAAHARQMGKMQIDEAIKSDRLIPSEGMRLLADYERGLKEYTYLT